MGGGNMTVQVSIGLPVYNGEKFLRQSFDSILAQSFGDFELIISDNASTDSTADICEEYAARDKRIRYYRSEANVGAAKNYNRVFELSQGKYFRWATHDDMLAASNLERCLEAFNKADDDVVLCYPLSRIIDAEGKIIGSYDSPLHLPMPFPDWRLLHLLRYLKICNALFGLIRSDVLRRTHLIGGYYASDVTLLAELSLFGKFLEISEPLFLRRLHSGTSRRANRNYSDVAAWFDPVGRNGFAMPLCNLFFQQFRIIGSSPLSGFEKFCCYTALCEEWPARYWRQIAGEVKEGLKRFVKVKRG